MYVIPKPIPSYLMLLSERHIQVGEGLGQGCYHSSLVPILEEGKSLVYMYTDRPFSPQGRCVGVRIGCYSLLLWWITVYLY